MLFQSGSRMISTDMTVAEVGQRKGDVASMILPSGLKRRDRNDVGRNILFSRPVGSRMPTPTLPQKPDLPAPASPTPTPPVPQIGLAPVQAGDGPLVAQYQALTQQLAGLQAQRRMLLGQVGSPQPIVATTARAQLTQIEAEIARVSVERAGVLGQINARPTQPGVRPPFDYAQNCRRSGMNSGDVTAIFVTFILAVLMPISIGITRRLLRRNPKGQAPPRRT